MSLNPFSLFPSSHLAASLLSPLPASLSDSKPRSPKDSCFYMHEAVRSSTSEFILISEGFQIDTDLLASGHGPSSS